MTKQAPPQLVAEFETDAHGDPRFVEQGGLKHYKIVFEIQNIPANAYAATFELDPSYYDPVRTLRPDPDGKIRLETTAFGDYDVKVRVRTKEGEVPVFGTLKTALQNSAQRGLAAANPAVDAALEYIASH